MISFFPAGLSTTAILLINFGHAAHQPHELLVKRVHRRGVWFIHCDPLA